MASLVIALEVVVVHGADSNNIPDDLLKKSTIAMGTVDLSGNMRQGIPNPPCRPAVAERGVGCACFLRFQRGVSAFDTFLLDDVAACERSFGPIAKTIRFCRRILRTRNVNTRRATRRTRALINRCIPGVLG